MLLCPVLRYAWAMPATLVGILLAGFARMSGATVVVTDGVLEVAGGRVGRAISLLPCSLQFSAVTLGHVVIGVSHDVLTQCRVHEQVHVRQYEKWGVLFFLLYVGSSLMQLLRGRSPYWHNYFEREAYRAERDVERPRSLRQGRRTADAELCPGNRG